MQKLPRLQQLEQGRKPRNQFKPFETFQALLGEPNARELLRPLVPPAKPQVNYLEDTDRLQQIQHLQRRRNKGEGRSVLSRSLVIAADPQAQTSPNAWIKTIEGSTKALSPLKKPQVMNCAGLIKLLQQTREQYGSQPQGGSANLTSLKSAAQRHQRGAREASPSIKLPLQPLAQRRAKPSLQLQLASTPQQLMAETAPTLDKASPAGIPPIIISTTRASRRKAARTLMKKEPSLGRDSLNQSTTIYSNQSREIPSALPNLKERADDQVSKQINHFRRKLFQLKSVEPAVIDSSMDSSASLLSVNFNTAKVVATPETAQGNPTAMGVPTTFESHLSFTLDSPTGPSPGLSPEASAIIASRAKKLSLPRVKPLAPKGELVALSRKVEDLERARSRDKKDGLRVRMWKKYQIQVSARKAFFTNSVELERSLLKKSEMIQRRRAAIRIQRLFRRRKARAMLLKKLKQIQISTRAIQSQIRVFQFRKNINCRIWAKQEAASFTIQKCLRGYLGRQAILPGLSNLRTDAVHHYFRSIDFIMKSHSQRVIRRVWLKYKREKDEKRAINLQNSALRQIQSQDKGRRDHHSSEAPAVAKKPQPSKFKSRPSHLTSSPVKKKNGRTSQVSDKAPTLEPPPKKTREEFERDRLKHLDDLAYSIKLSLGLVCSHNKPEGPKASFCLRPSARRLVQLK